jgi:hypothetical protein
MGRDQPNDLQIFLGRIPGEQPTQDEGIPSLVVTEGPATATRDLSQPPGTVEESRQSYSSEKRASYIAVANSTVVEALSFPFTTSKIIKMVSSLETSQPRLHECASFGSHLFDFLFNRSIRDLLRRLEDKGGQLRVTIATSVPELAYLPWELLCDTNPGQLPRFLTCHRDTHLVRSLRLFNRAEFSASTLGDGDGDGDGRLRLLIVTANPLRQAPIDVEKEEEMLRFALRPTQVNGIVEIYVLHNADIQSLRDKLLEYKPHVVHLACHGDYNREDDQGVIALASAGNPNEPEFINSYRVAMLLREPDSVQLVFVNTCYGAYPGKSSAFSGTAQSLHAIGIPEVVALQFALLDTTAHAIVLNFYKYLFQEGVTVEAAVSKIRQHLFISGYAFRESFGLVLYQANATLAFPTRVALKRHSPTRSKDFRGYADAFEEQSRKAITERISSEIDNLRTTLQEIANLKTEDLLEAVINFGGRHSLMLRVLKQVSIAMVPIKAFNHMMGISKTLAHQRNEGKPFEAAILLWPMGNTEKSDSNHSPDLPAPLIADLRLASIKEILDVLIRINVSAQALLVTVDEQSDAMAATIQDLRSDAPAEQSETINFGAEWSLLAHNTRHGGCGFIISGAPTPTIKIVLNGRQVAEHSGGAWREADLGKIREYLLSLSQQTGLGETLLFNVMEKCLVASERRTGLTMIIQRDDAILPKCHDGYIKIYGATGASKRIKVRKIVEMNSNDYLTYVAGDNAVILSRDGYILAIRAMLEVKEATKVNRIPGTGSRHLSAQKITKETDAVGFVVSQDGPVTIFLYGNAEQFFTAGVSN